MKIGSGRGPLKGCGCQWLTTKQEAFQRDPRGSALNLLLLGTYLNGKAERTHLFSSLLGNATCALLDKIKIQNDLKIAEMVWGRCSQVSAEKKVLIGNEICNPNAAQLSQGLSAGGFSKLRTSHFKQTKPTKTNKKTEFGGEQHVLKTQSTMKGCKNQACSGWRKHGNYAFNIFKYRSILVWVWNERENRNTWFNNINSVPSKAAGKCPEWIKREITSLFHTSNWLELLPCVWAAAAVIPPRASVPRTLWFLVAVPVLVVFSRGWTSLYVLRRVSQSFSTKYQRSYSFQSSQVASEPPTPKGQAPQRPPVNFLSRACSSVSQAAFSVAGRENKAREQLASRDSTPASPETFRTRQVRVPRITEIKMTSGQPAMVTMPLWRSPATWDSPEYIC